MNTIVAAMGCVINEKGEILLALRNDPDSPKVHHKWQLPGGAVDKGETVEEAIVREVKEETGLNVMIVSKRPAVTFGVINEGEHSRDTRILLIAYACREIGGILGKDIVDETAELRWFNIKEIPWKQVLNGNQEVITLLMRSVE